MVGGGVVVLAEPEEEELGWNLNGIEGKVRERKEENRLGRGENEGTPSSKKAERRKIIAP